LWCVRILYSIAIPGAISSSANSHSFSLYSKMKRQLDGVGSSDKDFVEFAESTGKVYFVRLA
jgi:hypothetical protein